MCGVTAPPGGEAEALSLQEVVFTQVACTSLLFRYISHFIACKCCSISI